MKNIKAVIYVILDKEVNIAKAVHCGKIVTSYSFAPHALQLGTKIVVITQATLETN